MKKYVLDTCAVVALFKKEDGADIVENIFVDAMQGRCSISMHRLNLLEVFYNYLRSDGIEIANKRVAAIENSCVNVVDAISKALMYKAGEIKVAHRMSLADSIGVALAISEQAAFVTSDHHELDSVDNSGIAKFLWIR